MTPYLENNLHPRKKIFGKFSYLFYMKYLITESQHELLNRRIPSWIRRRATKEYLEVWIDGEDMLDRDYCDSFMDADSYMESVIEFAIQDMLQDKGEGIEEEEYYSDVMDFLRNRAEMLFGERLRDKYNNMCGKLA
jgi:hypothetical protein